MQLHDTRDNRRYSKFIFVFICGLVTLVTLPITIHHLTNIDTVYSTLTHVASLAVAVFISYVAIAAYLRTTKKRMLFMALGFTTLAMIELSTLLTATGNLYAPVIPVINVEFVHFALLVMVSLFGVGVLRVD